MNKPDPRPRKIVNKAGVDELFANLHLFDTAARQAETPKGLDLIAATVADEARECRRNHKRQCPKFDYKAADSHQAWLEDKLYKRENQIPIPLPFSRKNSVEDIQLALIILKCCRRLAENGNDRMPTGNQVIATLFRHPKLDGPYGKKTLSAVNLMSSNLLKVTPGDENLARGSSRFWLGNIHHHGYALRLKAANQADPKAELQPIMLAAIELLSSEVGKVFSTTELRAALLPKIAKTDASNYLSSIMGILCALKLAVRHPDYRLEGESQPTRAWSFIAPEYKRYPATSIALRILEHAATSPGGWLIDITAKPGRRGANYFSPTMLSEGVAFLKNLDFIDVSKVNPSKLPSVPKPELPITRGVLYTRVELSSLVKGLVTKWAKKHVGESMPAAEWEPIRKAILQRVKISSLPKETKEAR